MENIVINVDFQRWDLSSIFANEVQVVPGDIAWEDLELMLKIYSNHNRVKVFYADDDNDLVIIESQEELEEAFKVARKCNNTLKLTVMCSVDEVEEEEAGPPEVADADQEHHAACDSQFHEVFSTGRQKREPLGECWLLPRGFDERPEHELSRRDGDADGEIRDGAGNTRDVSSETEPDSLKPKPFFIVNSRCQQMVLDVEGAGTHPGARVIVWYRKTPKEGFDNQLWYRDDRTATIRTCLNDFCLDVVDGRLVVNPCDLNRINQKWTTDGNRIRNIFNFTWFIGLKKDDAEACDQVFGLAEEQLVNVDWIFEDVCSQFVACSFGGNVFMPYNFLGRVCGRQHGYVVVCDVCNQVIHGIRYKCGFCPNFDLCAACEAKDGTHDPTHVLLKLRVPPNRAQMKFSTIEPILMESLLPHAPVHPSGMAAICKKVQKLQRKEEKLFRKVLKLEEKAQRKSSRKFEESFTQTQAGRCKAAVACELASKFMMGRQCMMQDMGDGALTFDIKNCDQADGVDDEKTGVGTEMNGAYSRALADQLMMDEDDILSAEVKRISTVSLTVPSNTPLADTPPYTPKNLEAEELESGSSQIRDAGDVTNAATTVTSAPQDSPDLVNMAVMADLVHKKMSDLVNDEDEEFEYVDVDGGSDSTSSSDDDFYVVPIPDCFNINLPARKEASTSVVVKRASGNRESVCSLKSVDEMLRTSSCLATAPLLSPRSCVSIASASDAGTDPFESKYDHPDLTVFETTVPEPSDVQQEDVGASGGETLVRMNASCDAENGAAATEPLDEEPTIAEKNNAEADAAAESREEDSEPTENVNQNETDPVNQANESSNADESVNETMPESENQSNPEAANSQFADASSLASGVEASTLKLMSSVLSFVAKTAKDVFHTLQDKNPYIPPRSDWVPPQNQWTPSTTAWTPIHNQWTPPSQPTWAPPDENAPFQTESDHQSPMDQLIDMGFADRQTNQQLLDTCNNDVEAVVQKLLDLEGNRMR